jgi:hypothetical protein
MNEKGVLRYVFSRLAGGQNIALIAPTSQGKTELLWQIGNPDTYLYWLPSPPQWVFAYIAAGEFGVNDTVVEFWQKIWQAFANQAMGQSWQALLEELSSNSTTQPFSSNRLFRQLDEQRVRLVLLLDNLDQLIERPRLFTPDLLAPLRSLSSRHQSFSVVFTSQRRLSELNRLVAMSGSPPFNNFNEILLSEFAVT